MKETLASYLKTYSQSGVYPMHMPGHKRNIPQQISELMSDIYGMDVTEVPGTDNLHEAQGILRDSMEHAAQVYKVPESIYLVNGSTCGNLAAIHAVVHRDDEIIICADSHRSVRHALITTGAKAHELIRPITDDTYMQGSIDPKQIRNLLEQDTDRKIKAVHITSPTYDGVLSDIKSIAQIVHEYNLPLIVDEAHGAHLTFLDRAMQGKDCSGMGGCLNGHIPYSATECGADIVLQSLHKTLPALTQVSIMHICSSRVDAYQVRQALDIYETSSPSYVLMASIDACIRYMETDGLRDMMMYANRLKAFRKQIVGLDSIHVWEANRKMKESGEIYDIDPGKLVLYAPGVSGEELSAILRDSYQIETERTTDRYVLAMTSAWDSDAGFERLSHAIRDIDDKLKKI